MLVVTRELEKKCGYLGCWFPRPLLTHFHRAHCPHVSDEALQIPCIKGGTQTEATRSPVLGSLASRSSSLIFSTEQSCYLAGGPQVELYLAQKTQAQFSTSVTVLISVLLACLMGLWSLLRVRFCHDYVNFPLPVWLADSHKIWNFLGT